MHRKYGVGPVSLLVVAVNVTEPPTAGDVPLAVSATVHPLLAKVGVHRSLTLVALVPSAFVAVMWLVVLLEGEVATRDVGEETDTLVARTVPKLTCVALSKPLPRTWTAVPPDQGPLIGLPDAMVGAAAAGGTEDVALGDGVALALALGVGDGDGLPHVTTTGVPTA